MTVEHYAEPLCARKPDATSIVVNAIQSRRAPEDACRRWSAAELRAAGRAHRGPLPALLPACCSIDAAANPKRQPAQANARCDSNWVYLCAQAAALHSLGQLAALTEALARRYRPLIAAALQLPSPDASKLMQSPISDADSACGHAARAEGGAAGLQLPHPDARPPVQVPAPDAEQSQLNRPPVAAEPQPARAAPGPDERDGSSGRAARQGGASCGGGGSGLAQPGAVEGSSAGVDTPSEAAAASSTLLVLEQVPASLAPGA